MGNSIVKFPFCGHARTVRLFSNNVNRDQAFADAVWVNAALDLGLDSDEGPLPGYLDPQFFAITFFKIVPVI